MHQTKKGEAPVCTYENLLATLRTEDGGLPLTGGLYTEDAPLKLVSEKMKNPVDYDSDVFFVEVKKDSSGRVVSEGQCGDPDETVAAHARVDSAAAGARAIVRTDSSIAAPLLGVAGGVVILGLIMLVSVRRRQAAE